MQMQTRVPRGSGLEAECRHLARGRLMLICVLDQQYGRTLPRYLLGIAHRC